MSFAASRIVSVMLRRHVKLKEFQLLYFISAPLINVSSKTVDQSEDPRVAVLIKKALREISLSEYMHHVSKVHLMIPAFCAAFKKIHS